MMRAVVFHEHGPFDNLAVEDIAEPTLEPGACLVRVRAVSLNGFDPMVMRGIPGLKTPLPMIPGADISGEIAAVGEGVTGWREGQHVAVQPNRPDGMMGETLRGAMCELIAVPQEYLIAVPDGVSHAETACMPTAYGTAYRMLHTRGGIQAGEKVLILGASGGVGTCCVQLAKAAGCEVIAVTSSAEKAGALTAMGADRAIDTSSQNFVRAVIEHCGKPRTRGEGGGVDVCVNYTGGETWAQCFRMVRKHGRILTCGATAGYDPKTDIRYIWSFEHTIIGSDGWSREDHEALLAMVAEGRLKPVIDRTIPMEEVASGMRALADRRVVGKVVVEVE